MQRPPDWLTEFWWSSEGSSNEEACKEDGCLARLEGLEKIT